MKATTKKKIKKILIYAVAAISLIATIALIGNLSDGFKNLNPKDWDILERNEDNVIPLDGMEEKYRTELGVTVEQKNGVLTLSGKNKSDTEAKVDIVTFKLPAGTYTFTTALKGVNDDTSAFSYYMTLVKASDSSLITKADSSKSFTIAAETEVTLRVNVADGEEVDGVKLYPSIVEGSEAASYYGNSDKD